MEYNKPLVLISIDYEKAVDTIDQNKILYALVECRIDQRYLALIENTYAMVTVYVRLLSELNTNKININRGVYKGDTTSPYDLTTLLEYKLKKNRFWITLGLPMILF